VKETDALGLYFPWICACIEAGDATEPGFELWLVDNPAPGSRAGEKGFGCCVIWLLAAEEVGSGGEKGNGGYCIEVRRLTFDTAGEMVGAGSSSTPRARSLASLSSSTYASHSESIDSISTASYRVG